MKPAREIARNNGQTYFLTFTTAERKPFFRNERWAFLLVNVLDRHRRADEFQLHDFVVMPDHLHLLVTPNGALERTAQLIKGGYSFQAKRAFEWKGYISGRQVFRIIAFEIGLISSSTSATLTRM